MFRKLLLVLGAIIFFYVSKSQFQEIAATGGVRAKFGLMLCDRTKDVWASCPAIFGFLCIWAVLGNSKKVETDKGSITRE